MAAIISRVCVARVVVNRSICPAVSVKSAS
jgi:hypothetical protein